MTDMLAHSAAASTVPTSLSLGGIYTPNLIQYIDPFRSPVYGNTVQDLSISNNNATINGGMTKGANGWELGTGKYLTLGLPSFDLDASFTAEVWMYSTTNTSSQLLAFMSKYSNSGSRRWGFGQGNNTGGTDYSRVIMVSTLTFDFTYGNPMTYNTWYQWVFAMGPSTYQVYKNGVLEISGGRIAGSLNTSNTGPIVAGGPFGTVVAQYFDNTSRMGLTRLYTQQLTDVQVLKNFNANKSDYGL